MDRRWILRCLSLLSLLTCPCRLVAYESPQDLPPDLDGYVARVMTEFEVPGIALTIVKDGETSVAKGSGVRRLGERAPVDEHTRFGIASNTKLFTGALALDRLGPDFRLRTSLYAAARPDAGGELAADLIVFGRGDPSFSPRFHRGGHFAAFEKLADVLDRAGVKRIRGDLIGDESFFRTDGLGSGWTWDDLGSYYRAEVSALSAIDNVLAISVKPAEAVGAPCRVATSPPTSYVVTDSGDTDRE